MELKDKKVLVVGLGVSGCSAAGFLLGKGAQVSVTDEAPSGELRGRADGLLKAGARVETGGHTLDFCAGHDLVVSSPGIDPSSLPLEIARRDGVPVIGELELGSLFCRGTMIAITGTNGKSTTTELIGNILSSAGRQAAVCGNIGTPLTSEAEKLTEDGFAVIEVSSFQLDRIKTFKPYIAVLLNVTEDHYERYGNIDGYKGSKYRIFENQDGNDWAVIHSDLAGDPLTAGIKSRKLFYGPGGDAIRLEEGGLFLSEEDSAGTVIRTGDIPIEGRHNLENVMCSILVARTAGIEVRDIASGVMSFKGLSHRFERIGCRDGVEFIDDSKATNIDAARRALESADKRVVLIAGGIDKGGDYRSILPLVREKVKAMVLIGEAADKIERVFGDHISTARAVTMAEAVEKAGEIAVKGEAVMLSPMCSSFDMFSSYKERGEVFQREVRRAIGEMKPGPEPER